jgi:hypothetical protein
MPQRRRKRSTAITLVLAGSATLAGCGSPVEQRDAYASMQDCVRDWSNAAVCEPVRDGRYAQSYFYGPPYYAASGWSLFGPGRTSPSPNAMDAVRLQPGAVASSPTSQLAMRTGITPRSGSFGTSSSSSSSGGVARGGFGSSGASASG